MMSDSPAVAVWLVYNVTLDSLWLVTGSRRVQNQTPVRATVAVLHSGDPCNSGSVRHSLSMDL